MSSRGVRVERTRERATSPRCEPDLGVLQIRELSRRSEVAFPRASSLPHFLAELALLKFSPAGE